MSPLVGPRKRILVAEDDPSILQLVATILRYAGYDVETVSGGRAALAVSSATWFDVIVMDLMMPDVSGFEVLARLPPRAVPFVILMSAAAHNVIAQAASGKVFATLHKPFDIAAMVTTVQACIAATEPRLPSLTLQRIA